jgi:hypothetical protein
MREREKFEPYRRKGGATLRLSLAAACLFHAGLALGEAELARAASSGDLDAVRAALAAGGDVDAMQADGSSALLWAAYHADLEMTHALLEAGADANLANRYGVTPLLQASRTGQTPIMAAQLDGGADVAKTHPEGETALMGLESGIEIFAQPPGKKLGSLELMSGGEKALTAVSLIFAIFQFKPSPFCLLDEVDAPLDEANIARFCEMIREMTSQSQFILITHSKRTLELGEVLYGVTMETPGISKFVSVVLRIGPVGAPDNDERN